MRTSLKALGVAAAVIASALAWGYWYSATHASINIRVEDYGLQTDRQLYGRPHGVKLEFFDAAGRFLASAHSVEPAAYILAVHPDPAIGDCSAYQDSREKFAECYAQYSAWTSTWAPEVRTAAISTGGCSLRNLPVNVYTSNEGWWLWWVPLRHIGGTPRRYFDFAVKVNMGSCSGIPLGPVAGEMAG
ncbi:MAG: hypothetical protein ACM31P_20240 [Actinomycetota bacterium]